MTLLAEGQQLSHYKLMHLLRSGGMGEVYLAKDTLLKRLVAIKVINTDALRSSGTDAAKDAARLFLREAQAIAQLDHSNILPLYDSGRTHSQWHPTDVYGYARSSRWIIGKLEEFALFPAICRKTQGTLMGYTQEFYHQLRVASESLHCSIHITNTYKFNSGTKLPVNEK